MAVTKNPEAAPAETEPKNVIFRSPFYGYTATLWSEQRAFNNMTQAYDIVEGPRIARFQDVGIGGEYRTSDPREIERLRELCEKDKRGLYEVKTGREHLTPEYIPARKPGQTYRGNRPPAGEVLGPVPDFVT